MHTDGYFMSHTLRAATERANMSAQIKTRTPTPAKPRAFRVAGLFAGIGGIEKGLSSTGHQAALLCENDPSALAVLKARFPQARLHEDIRTLKALPRAVDLVTAGFPCQDLSQAGQTAGIQGLRSGLVGEVFRLIERGRTPWVLLENVPFMLQLARGRAMDFIVSTFEALGYKWAYRVVDTQSFGLPQRRRRVYFLASRVDDPRSILFADDAGTPPAQDPNGQACGFYWTEGLRGLGWAVNSVPTLKGGSTLGIPSPPAILMPSGAVIKPDLRDAERMQGFPQNWTKPAEAVARGSLRWKLVGNAVSVPVAAWLGKRLRRPGRILNFATELFPGKASWPNAAWNIGEGRYRVVASEWPKKRQEPPSLIDFLRFPGSPLSRKATAGFLSRTARAALRFPPGFIEALEAHLQLMQAADSREAPPSNDHFLSTAV